MFLKPCLTASGNLSNFSMSIAICPKSFSLVFITKLHYILYIRIPFVLCIIYIFKKFNFKIVLVPLLFLFFLVGLGGVLCLPLTPSLAQLCSLCIVFFYATLCTFWSHPLHIVYKLSTTT